MTVKRAMLSLNVGLACYSAVIASAALVFVLSCLLSGALTLVFLLLFYHLSRY